MAEEGIWPVAAHKQERSQLERHAQSAVCLIGRNVKIPERLGWFQFYRGH